MITIIGEATTRRSPEEVFAFLSDPRNELSWHPNARAMEKTSPAPVGLGTSFRGVYRGAGTMTFAIDAYEPPARVHFSGTGRGFALESTIAVRPTRDGSHVTLEMTIAPHGLLRLLQPIMQPMMRRQYVGVMAAAKRALDGGAEPNPLNTSRPETGRGA